MADGQKGNRKQRQLDNFRIDDKGKKMTTNQGLKISEDEFSLKVGDRGTNINGRFSFP